MLFNSLAIKVKCQSFHTDNVSEVEVSVLQRTVMLTSLWRSVKAYILYTKSDILLFDSAVVLSYERSTECLQLRVKINDEIIYTSHCSAILDVCQLKIKKKV